MFRTFDAAFALLTPLTTNSQPLANRLPRTAFALDGLSRFWAWCIGAPLVVPLPRSRCHRIAFNLKGVGRRAAASSIRLQLDHVTGFDRSGFAWRSDGDIAQVWYWSEQATDSADSGTPSNIQLCPEMLLRPSMSDGLHLMACIQGYEALSVVRGQVYRSRWFAEVPQVEEWQRFVQDAGADPALHSLPTALVLVLRTAPASGWSVHSIASRPWSFKIWATLAAVTVVGAVFSVLVGYSLKLNYQIQSLRQDYAALAQQSAATLRLQQELEVRSKPIAAVVSFQPRVLQLRLMARLAEAGLFDEVNKVNLQEWEYRSNRIRIQFSVPAEGFALSQFLESIEKTGLFKDVRLLSGTPPLSVAIQAALVDDPKGAP